MQTADLHIHSEYSDGTDSLKELANNIIKNNLSAFALTDHDEIQGCTDILPFIPDNIQFIKGVELTCKMENIKCHILGYNIDVKNKELIELIQKGKPMRKKKLEFRINHLKEKYNIEFTKEELDWLYSRKSPVKLHVASALVKKNLAQDNSSAIKKYLDFHIEGNTRFDGIEAVNAILKSNGIPIWAHPLGGEGEKHLDKEEFYKRLDCMIENGIKGLECYYSRYSKEETEFLISTAKKNNLLISGGSDYHGPNKTGVSLANYLKDNLSPELFLKNFN